MITINNLATAVRFFQLQLVSHVSCVLKPSKWCWENNHRAARRPVNGRFEGSVTWRPSVYLSELLSTFKSCGLKCVLGLHLHEAFPKITSYFFDNLWRVFRTCLPVDGRSWREQPSKVQLKNPTGRVRIPIEPSRAALEPSCSLPFQIVGAGLDTVNVCN
jgi:hypothetical protein